MQVFFLGYFVSALKLIMDTPSVGEGGGHYDPRIDVPALSCSVWTCYEFRSHRFFYKSLFRRSRLFKVYLFYCGLQFSL